MKVAIKFSPLSNHTPVPLLLLLQFVAVMGYGQESEGVAHINNDLLDEGVATLNFPKGWRYQAGDDPAWAAIAYDDSRWQIRSPINLRPEKMPDSRWPGNGWWRLRFTADTAFCVQVERMFFETWGAAEVYLDGKLVQSYGKFSKNPAKEQTYVSNYSADKQLQIPPGKLHVLAVRFSNHGAKANQRLFKKAASDLGFTIGFATAERGTYSDGRYANSLARFSVIGVILIILLLLHLLLYFKFRRDSANLLISVITILFFIAALAAHISLFIPLTGFRNALISNFGNSTAFALAFSLIPYALTRILRIENFGWVKHLVWLVLVRSANFYFQFVPFVVFDGVIILFVIAFMVFLMVKGSRNKGVWYVTFGAIGTSFFLLLNRLDNADIVRLSNEMNYIDLVLLYVCFPLGIYIYNTNQYGSLFNAMEQEVANRTIDLNLSVENLKTTQADLARKNAENELLLKEIHHRVKNNLEVVSSLLALQAAQISDPEVQDAMQASQNRVQSMGILHQKLYQSEQLAFIEMKNYFVNLTENILDSYNATERVAVEFPMDNLELDIDTAVPVGLIVNELMTNALKYAFPVGVLGTIELSLREIGDNLLQLSVADNGVGKITDTTPQVTGFGTQLVDLLTRQLDGKLTQNVENGTMISIQFARK